MSSGRGDGTEVAARLMQGISEPLAYDLSSTNYVLSIGCEVLEGWMSPVWDMKGFSQFRGKRPRGRLIYAGPRRSVTAAKAESWIRLRPASQGAFALGIAYVLISERLYDFELFIRDALVSKTGATPKAIRIQAFVTGSLRLTP